MCRIEHMYYREGISSVIIDENVKYNTYPEFRLIMQDSDEKMLDSDSK